MRDLGVASTRGWQPRAQAGGRARSRCLAPGRGTIWSFVYVFFTNGIPFDAPNRSEPCPLS
jgi:hypothetical protein